MLLLAADESLHGHIVQGLRRRLPGIDLVTVDEAGRRGSADPDILEWVASEGRILVAQDRKTMIGFAWDRIAASLPMPGLIIRSDSVSIGQTIDDLLLIVQCGSPDEFQNQVRYLPL